LRLEKLDAEGATGRSCGLAVLQSFVRPLADAISVEVQGSKFKVPEFQALLAEAFFDLRSFRGAGSVGEVSELRF